MSIDFFESLIRSSLYKEHQNPKTATKPSEVVASYWSPLAKRELKKTAEMLGIKESDLLAIIAHETGGTFNPAQRVFGVADATAAQAKGLTGTGLIQFISSTAKSLLEKYHGKEAAKKMLAEAGGRGDVLFEKMSPETQLIFVREYFKDVASKIKAMPEENRAKAVYSFVFTGQLPPSNLNAEYARKGTQEYKANAGLDKNRDGKITYREIVESFESSRGKTPKFLAKQHFVPTDYLTHNKDVEELKKTLIDMLKSGELQPVFGSAGMAKVLTADMFDSIMAEKTNKERTRQLVNLLEKGSPEEQDVVMRWLVGHEIKEKDVEPLIRRANEQKQREAAKLAALTTKNDQDQATGVEVLLNKQEAQKIKKSLIDRVVDFLKSFKE